MFYFLDEPIEPFVRTVNGGLSSEAIMAIIISVIIVIAVAVATILIIKKRNG